ncbi:MAG: SusC/RagA family TonB-linked outer membrane protein, partial [Thermoanaerobaculia bacterium]|nr:SusC/RagA family TonB-linked outer membrane protein [Thermoanaerobaculia bacterium]
RGNNLTVLSLTVYHISNTSPTICNLIAREGESYGTLYGYDFYRDASGKPIVNPKNGYYMVNPTQKSLGNILPDWTGGVQNTLSYKSFSLGFLVDVRKGGKMAAGTISQGWYTGVLAETVANNIRETGAALPGVLQATDDNGTRLFNPDGSPVATGKPNDKTISAKEYWQTNLGSFGAQATRIYDAGFVKLREARLGYRLPDRLLRKSRLKTLQIAVVGRNLWLIHKNIPHIDPDNGISSGNVQGMEAGQIPSTRTLGINLTAQF